MPRNRDVCSQQTVVLIRPTKVYLPVPFCLNACPTVLEILYWPLIFQGLFTIVSVSLLDHTPFLWWNTYRHSQFPLKCPVSTPPVQNVYIPPQYQCWTQKALVELWAAPLGCAGREAGVGTMQVETTFLWMSDPFFWSQCQCTVYWHLFRSAFEGSVS